MKLNPHEIKTAKDWYKWLWFSPVFTIPTLLSLYSNNYDYKLKRILCPSGSCSPFLKYTMPFVILYLVSALWHLILLKPALDKESKFVRWHGRQALSLAGIRTFVPIGLTLLVNNEEDGFIYSIPILLLIWLVGNLWGSAQASKGQCSLMRWFGHQIPPMEPEPAASPLQEPSSDQDDLVESFRFSPDSQERKNALEELKRLGLVEHFDNE